MTVLECIEAGTQEFEQAHLSFGHGTDNAFDEAAWLVLWRLGYAPDQFEAVQHQVLTAEQQAQVQALLQQRITSRQPAAYLTGQAWLQGVPFVVDARALVPRSLIAELISDGTLDNWLSPDLENNTGDQPLRVLDLCTGGASLAILAALAWPKAQIDASDLSQDALAVAQLNLQYHQLQTRVRLLQGDGLQAAQGRYHLILCNPPYVNSASMQALPAEYRAEPALGLAGGVDGMDFIRPLLTQAKQHLHPSGTLVLEIGYERAHFEAAFPGLNPLWLQTSLGDDHVLALNHEALP